MSEVRECNISPQKYQEIVSGLRTFLIVPHGKFHVTDKLILFEKMDFGRTGRNICCELVGVYSGDGCGEGYDIVSFQISFPAAESRIPVKVYMALYQLFVDTKKQINSNFKED